MERTGRNISVPIVCVCHIAQVVGLQVAGGGKEESCDVDSETNTAKLPIQALAILIPA